MPVRNAMRVNTCKDTSTVNTAKLSVDAVVITQGRNLEFLQRSIDSLMTQTGVDIKIYCIGNGWAPEGLPHEVHTSFEPNNLGAPEARNRGAALGTSDLILFFDDDAWLSDERAIMQLAEYMRLNSRCGLLQPRLVDPENGRTEPRWVPRTLVGDPSRPGPAFTISEGVSLIRRELFDRIGGWAGDFFYGHEGIELTWQVWNHGFTARYVPQVVAHHPSGLAFRRPNQMWMNARNRVWVAKRNLPQPLRQIYLMNWWIISMFRLQRDSVARNDWQRGWLAGHSTESVAKSRKISLSTVLKLTCLGHPPII